jgi:ATP-dependent Clp protease ATP-binding subunit ClpC
MAIHGASIELTDDAKELLVTEGYDPAMGARPLRRSIQRLIEDPLADFVLGRDLAEGSTIVIDRKTDPGPDEPLVEIRIIEGEVKPEPVTVPADEPEAPAEDGTA